MSRCGNARTTAHGNYPWTWQSRRSDLPLIPLSKQTSTDSNERFESRFLNSGNSMPSVCVASSDYLSDRPDLAHPINHTFSDVRDRLVPFVQKFGENRKVLYLVLLGSRVGLNINNVDRRMPGKILLEGGPGAGQDPAASIETGDPSAEDITGERKRCDITRGRTPVSV